MQRILARKFKKTILLIIAFTFFVTTCFYVRSYSLVASSNSMENGLRSKSIENNQNDPVEKSVLSDNPQTGELHYGMSLPAVKPDTGEYHAVTSNSGGYAIPITSTGIYSVKFSGPSLNGIIIRTVDIGNESLLLDLVINSYAD